VDQDSVHAIRTVRRDDGGRHWDGAGGFSIEQQPGNSGRSTVTNAAAYVAVHAASLRASYPCSRDAKSASAAGIDFEGAGWDGV